MASPSDVKAASKVKGQRGGAEATKDDHSALQHKTFARLTADAWNLRRNVSFNNIAAFPTLPRGALGASALAGGTTSSPDALDDPMDPVSFSTKRLVVVMVGLPARGKSFMAQALCRFLNWLGFHCQVFNVGSRRRSELGAQHDAQFFDPENDEGRRVRLKLAADTMRDMIEWMVVDDGLVAVFDATNTTVDRRKMVVEYLEQSDVRHLFLESYCQDQSIIERNILQTKLFSPDYAETDPELAVQDFKRRIANYEKVYQSLGATEEEKRYSYVKVVDVGKQLVLNEITGYVPGKIVNYLLNTHIMPRTIYLSRHGESKWNVTGQLGGDPELTERGKTYAIKLADYMKEEFLDHGKNLPLVWTSQLQRTRQTVEFIPTVNVCWRALNEIDAGSCEGMTYEDINREFPDVESARKQDKLNYRYPGGESYVDVIHRIEPVLLELERQREDVLIVAHNAIVRAFYAYYVGIPQAEMPNIDIPLHTVFKIVPRAYKSECTVIPFEVENTYNNRTPEDSPSAQSPRQSAAQAEQVDNLELSESHGDEASDGAPSTKDLSAAPVEQIGNLKLSDSHGDKAADGAPSLKDAKQKIA